jgi:hypothetical protein
MKSSRHPDVTSRRSFLRQGATLAGAVTLPLTCIDVAEAGTEERGPIRLAQRGAGIVAPAPTITTKSTRLVGSSIDYAYAVKAGPWSLRCEKPEIPRERPDSWPLTYGNVGSLQSSGSHPEETAVAG